MKSFEPVRFNVEGRGFDIDENYQRRITGFTSSWDETHDFLLHKTLVEYFDEINRRTISERYREILLEEMESVNQVAPSIVDFLSPENGITRQGDRPTSTLYCGNDILAVPNQHEEGVFYLIGNNKNHVRDIRSKIIEDFEAAVDNYRGLGLKNLKIDYAEEFTKEIIKEKENVSKIEIGDLSDFEEVVYDELKPVSEAFINNVTVEFGGYQENPECDMILALGSTSSVYVEVKDYSGTENKASRENIIYKPLKKAELLDIDLTITVVKGIDDSKLAEFKQSAELRSRFAIVEKQDVEEKVVNHIEKRTPSLAISRIGWHNF